MKKAPGCLKVHVIQGMGLAVRDKWKRSSDPYVRVNLGILQVLDKDTFSSDDKMGDAEIDLQPLIRAVRGLKERQRTSSDPEIAKVVADKSNCLVNDSRIRYAGGNVVQDVHLRLRNVECGQLKLQLKWVENELKN